MCWTWVLYTQALIKKTKSCHICSQRYRRHKSHRRAVWVLAGFSHRVKVVIVDDDAKCNRHTPKLSWVEKWTSSFLASEGRSSLKTMTFWQVVPFNHGTWEEINPLMTKNIKLITYNLKKKQKNPGITLTEECQCESWTIRHYDIMTRQVKASSVLLITLTNSGVVTRTRRGLDISIYYLTRCLIINVITAPSPNVKKENNPVKKEI